MPFEYIDHEADAWVIGIGATPEEAFVEGAKATFNLMVDIEQMTPRKTVEISCRADDIEELFVAWLNELILAKDIHGLVFSDFEVAIRETNTGFELTGKARGEPPDPERHELRTEVKAATYHGLKFERTDGEYRVGCVVDL
ncbi:MAG: archease [Candidatus Bipolaricaulia bacterium]